MEFEKKYGRLNFGDSINPMLFNYFFKKSIIDSKDTVLIGIGTILNDENKKKVAHYKKKIVFSSGTGYGDFELTPDESWEFVCVRGPLTANKLKLSKNKGICDGAILLREMFPPNKDNKRSGTLLIPHVDSISRAGKSLELICDSLNIKMLSPEEPIKVFINEVRSAELVITEAMHGAILADTMRTPWIPIDMMGVEKLKWQDWFLSVELQGHPNIINPILWDKQLEKNKIISLEKIKSYIKMEIVKKRIKRLLNECKPLLSSDEVLEKRLFQLHEKIDYINETYS
jgi:succinoglycan biosynthesis protein ExoV